MAHETHENLVRDSVMQRPCPFRVFRGHPQLDGSPAAQFERLRVAMTGAEQIHCTERGRATAVADAEITGRPRR